MLLNNAREARAKIPRSISLWTQQFSKPNFQNSVLNAPNLYDHGRINYLIH